MSTEFGMILNFSNVCLMYFGTTLSVGVCGFEFWYRENMFGFVRGVENDLKKNLIFFCFPHLSDLFGDFVKPICDISLTNFGR